MTKKCAMCLENKPKSKFGKYSSRPDGLHYYCKKCVAEYKTKLRCRNPEKYKQYAKRYRENNRQLCRDSTRRWAGSDRGKLVKRVKEGRRRAQRAGNGGFHSWEEWVKLIQELPICVRCGQPGNEHTLTQDHIIPITKGGSDFIWNIQPLCSDCNLKKFTACLDYRMMPGIPVVI